MRAGSVFQVSGVNMVCHSCKRDITLGATVSRTEECPHCGADVHCCLNCINYDPSAHNRCREPQAEWVSDREKANFCDFFMPNRLTSAGTSSNVTDARKAFDSLFKK